MRYYYGTRSIATFTEKLVNIRQCFTFPISFKNLIAIIKASTLGTEIAIERSVRLKRSRRPVEKIF